MKTYLLVTDYQKRVHNNLVKEGKNPDTFEVQSPSGKAFKKKISIDFNSLVHVKLDIVDNFTKDASG